MQLLFSSTEGPAGGGTQAYVWEGALLTVYFKVPTNGGLFLAKSPVFGEAKHPATRVDDALLILVI